MKDCFRVNQKGPRKVDDGLVPGSKCTRRLPVGCGRSVRRRWGLVGAACQIEQCHRQRPLRASVASQAQHRARWLGAMSRWPGRRRVLCSDLACPGGPWNRRMPEWQNGRTPRGGRPGGRQARGAVRRAHEATGHCPATREAPEPNQRVRGCEQPPSAPRLATFRPLVPPSARSDGAFKSTEIHPIPRLVALKVFAATKSCSGRPSSHRRFLRIARASSSCVCRFATFSFLLACVA